MVYSISILHKFISNKSTVLQLICSHKYENCVIIQIDNCEVSNRIFYKNGGLMICAGISFPRISTLNCVPILENSVST